MIDLIKWCLLPSTILLGTNLVPKCLLSTLSAFTACSILNLKLYFRLSTLRGMPTKRLNIAIAGLGRMVSLGTRHEETPIDRRQGKRHVYTLVNRVPRARVVAVCSTERSEQLWARQEYRNAGIEVYTSYDEMLDHPGLQAVWVSTSTDVHASQTLAGIQKGLHVLCEKPLSTSSEIVGRTAHYPAFSSIS